MKDVNITNRLEFVAMKLQQIASNENMKLEKWYDELNKLLLTALKLEKQKIVIINADLLKLEKLEEV